MKNRIDACFEQLKNDGRKALISFITVGAPDMNTTEKCVIEMFRKGADIIELGVPFSDPIAESPTIQKASLQSLKSGTTLDKVFNLVKSIRSKTNKPLLLTMYLNTIFKYGTEKFFSLCNEYGIDGVIVPDMPFEEREEILPYSEKYGVYAINQAVPRFHDRLNMIGKASKGFLYVISSSCKEISSQTDFDEIPCPACVEFDNSDTQSLSEISSRFDGIIVNNAIVDIVSRSGSNAPEKVGQYIQILKSKM